MKPPAQSPILARGGAHDKAGDTKRGSLNILINFGSPPCAVVAQKQLYFGK